MKKNLILIVIASLGISCAHAESIEFSAKETGFLNLDYSAKELSYTDKISVLNIPGFNNRSAEASRWMMCVYTNIALMRHQKYWIAAYPTDASDNVSIGFPESENPEDSGKLGKEFIGDHALKIMPVDKMLMFCVKAGYKFKYAPNNTPKQNSQP